MAKKTLPDYMDAEPPITLYADQQKFLWTFIVCVIALLALMGIIYKQIHEQGHTDTPFLILIGIPFLGLGTLFSLMILLFPEKQSLILNREGFILRTPWRSWTVQWADVSVFTIGTPVILQVEDTLENISNLSNANFNLPSTTNVQLLMFNLPINHPCLSHFKFLAHFNQMVSGGYDCALSNNYDLSLSDFEQIMNHYRTKYTTPA